MNETQTKKDLIDPAIEKAGWAKANGCQVLVEQSAVQFAPGKVHGKPLAAMYICSEEIYAKIHKSSQTELWKMERG